MSNASIDLNLRIRYINQKFKKSLQMIDRFGDVVWLGIWADETVDLEAIKDYLTTDSNTITIVPAFTCITFSQNVLREFSYVIRVDLVGKKA